ELAQLPLAVAESAASAQIAGGEPLRRADEGPYGLEDAELAADPGHGEGEGRHDAEDEQVEPEEPIGLVKGDGLGYADAHVGHGRFPVAQRREGEQVRSAVGAGRFSRADAAGPQDEVQEGRV